LLDFVDELESVAGKRCEVVVTQLLSFGGMRSLKGTTSRNNVRSTESQVFANEEKFLLNSRVREDIVVTLESNCLEELQGILLECVASTQEGELLVEGVALPRVKAGGNA